MLRVFCRWQGLEAGDQRPHTFTPGTTYELVQNRWENVRARAYISYLSEGQRKEFKGLSKPYQIFRSELKTHAVQTV